MPEGRTYNYIIIQSPNDEFEGGPERLNPPMRNRPQIPPTSKGVALHCGASWSVVVSGAEPSEVEGSTP